MNLLRRLFFNNESSSAVPEKIEIFSRHCIFSSISSHKKRFPGFSREACYRNLIETLDPNKTNLTFWLDTAHGTIEDHFLKDEKRYPVLSVQEGSEAGSFLSLLDYLERNPLDPNTIVYLVEDDYLHRPGWTDVLLEAFQLPGIDYATLYDHKDKYFFPEYKKLNSHIFVTPSCHWRTAPSTTHTFAVRYKTLQKHMAIHRRFSKGRKISADHQKFCHLQKKGATLISSIPAWSTHAEPEFASPCIDWQTILTSNTESTSCPM